MTVGEGSWLAERFEEYRGWLYAVAYRMLGSADEADDAVRDTWLRLTRSDVADTGNLAGWLTAVTVGVCLDAQRARHRGGQEPRGRQDPTGADTPGWVSQPGVPGPPDEAALAETAGRVLPLVLGTLAPDERLAFVLHEIFGTPFDAIAPILGRSPATAEVLASGARRRLGGPAPEAGTDREREQAVAGAFLDACRWEDVDAVKAVLDASVVLRVDNGPAAASHARVVRGADDVALQALMFYRVSAFVHPALVNGVPGLIAAPLGQSLAVMHFTIRDGKIAAIDILTDPAHLAQVDLTLLNRLRHRSPPTPSSTMIVSTFHSKSMV